MACMILSEIVTGICLSLYVASAASSSAFVQMWFCWRPVWSDISFSLSRYSFFLMSGWGLFEVRKCSEEMGGSVVSARERDGRSRRWAGRGARRRAEESRRRPCMRGARDSRRGG
eukprot:scaffold126933_cov39-Tisochrysis_lutea.AAC.4